MVLSCCVVACTNRAKKGSTKHFYRIPRVVHGQGEAMEQITERRYGAVGPFVTDVYMR